IRFENIATPPPILCGIFCKTYSRMRFLLVLLIVIHAVAGLKCFAKVVLNGVTIVPEEEEVCKSGMTRCSKLTGTGDSGESAELKGTTMKEKE
ncbi:hypothetical protein PFISCL1PPCAC_8683, partial [Pristionchus fissidentatus]